MTNVVYALVEGMNVRYVGYSARVQRRRKDHLRKYPDWRFLVIGAYATMDEGLAAEVWWISRLAKLDHPIINVSPGGERSVLGVAKSSLTRARMSAVRIGRPHPQKPHGNPNGYPSNMKGRHHTPEAIAKNREAHLGKKASPETRAKMSAIRKGRTVPEETRAKMRASALKRCFGGACGKAYGEDK